MRASDEHRPNSLSTAQTAAASGYSVQQVRDLERLGVIPPAYRAPNGYRRFSPLHLTALRAYRNLALAVGPAKARQAVRELRTLPLDSATALISSFHATLVRARADALAALNALAAIRAEVDGEADPAEDDAMTISELAAALGVRASTLRFWESSGLVTPERVTSMGARRYPPAAVREARIAAALRAAGYGIADVEKLMRSLRDLDGPDNTQMVLRARLDTIAAQMCALLEAGTDFTQLLTSP